MSNSNQSLEKSPISRRRVVKVVSAVSITAIILICMWIWYIPGINTVDIIPYAVTGYLKYVYFDENEDAAIFIAVVNASEDVEKVYIEWETPIWIENWTKPPAVRILLAETNSSIEWIDIGDDGMILSGDVIILHKAKQWSGCWLVIPISATHDSSGCATAPLWGKIP